MSCRRCRNHPFRSLNALVSRTSMGGVTVWACLSPEGYRNESHDGDATCPGTVDCWLGFCPCPTGQFAAGTRGTVGNAPPSPYRYSNFTHASVYYHTNPVPYLYRPGFNNGLASPVGTVVTAFINGVEQGSATVRAGGAYKLTVSQGTGTAISFKVGDLDAAEIACWVGM